MYNNINIILSKIIIFCIVTQYIIFFYFQFALHVYSELITAGQKYGLRHAGYYAMRALRIEKFYAFWGQDLDTATTPLECGRAWRVKFDVKRTNIYDK